MKNKNFNVVVQLGIVLLFFLFPQLMSGRDFVHIFTSKGIYETCEDLWFKCLVIDDSDFSLSGKTQTAFVEIVSSSDSVVWREKYPVVDGECDGLVYVGDDWETGEYRMYVNTAGSLGTNDTIMTPKRLLIVQELPEAQKYVSDKGNAFIKVVDSIEYGKIRPLNITIDLDSTEYHIRSKVRAKVKVTDSDGNPVRADIALSVFDRLYSYAYGDLDVVSHSLGIQEAEASSTLEEGERVLSYSPITGTMMSGKKKSGGPMEDQFMTVFDYNESMGNLNIISTGTDGKFEIPVDLAVSLDKTVLLKPVSGKELKPILEFNDNFDKIANIRKNTKDKFFPFVSINKNDVEVEDSFDYVGRRIVHLDEIEVKGHAGRYPKRNKLLGYLDSISTPYGSEWVCGCPAGYGTSFLNDYVSGYTHHPGNESYQPVKRSKPIKGKSYVIVKYTGGQYHRDYLLDLQVITYNGPKYSEEELLKMNGIWKTTGYYPSHGFVSPKEEEMSIGVEDNRNTLLWLPKAETDENGELEIEFYTSDISSIFYIDCVSYQPNGNSYGNGHISFRVK